MNMAASKDLGNQRICIVLSNLFSEFGFIRYELANENLSVRRNQIAMTWETGCRRKIDSSRADDA
jgi:hypothetical protein